MLSLCCFEILGVRISAVNLEKAYAVIHSMIREKRPGYICVAPVSTIMSCQDDPAYKAVVNGAAMVTPDGMPVVWLGRRVGFPDVRRTYGPDLMQLVCEKGQADGFRHYLLGGSETVNEQLARKLRQWYPAIQIVGRYAPPFRAVTPAEEEVMFRAINDSGADIVWVGLGSPKQDFWMQRCRDKIKPLVLVGVGAAFDFLSGHKAQAPRWIQRAGLEWLFRFCCEPGRLWRRYLLGNSRFIYLLLTRRPAVRREKTMGSCL